MNKKAILAILTIIEVVCLFLLKNEPYIELIMIITIIIWLLTAAYLKRN